MNEPTPTHQYRRPRLLHVTTVPQTLTFLTAQSAFVKSKGFDVHALSSPGPELAEFGDRLHIDVHALEMPRRITPFKDLLTLRRLRKILRQLRPDIVHGHTPKGGLLAMMGAWVCGTPVRIYHVHGLPMVTATGIKRMLLRLSEKLSCRLATQVYSVSESVRELAVSEGLCPADKMKVLLNGTIDGIDAENTFNPSLVDSNARQDIRQQYGIPGDALVVGFAGRIVRDKGLIELTQAWQVLREEYPSLHLLLAGPFEPQDPLPADVEKLLRGDARIHLAGKIAVSGMPRFYQAIDLLVLPTYREGFNTVLLEAAAMELPVVASRVPGCIDGVVEGETGALAPSHDAHRLAAALRVYLGNAALRREHGVAGRLRVLRDYRPADLSAAIHAEYLRLLKNQDIDVPPEASQAVLPGANQSVASSQNERRSNLREELVIGGSTFYRRHGKRIFDVLASAVGLLILAPLFFILAVSVRIFHGSPVLFRQQRSGRKRQPFTILKFRTMTNERDATGELLAETRRLTRFGRFLRSTSLDELPELWNVLIGDMTLVGPRPLLPRYDAYYTDREGLRFELLPGITGWAQINGRNDLVWDDRLECDAWYVERCSLFLDLKILVLTVLKVMRRDNVQADPGAVTFGDLDAERRLRLAKMQHACNGEVK